MRARSIGHLLICFVAGLALLPAAPAASQPASSAAALFGYDRDAPLDVTEVGSERRGGIEIRDLAYGSGAGPVEAYLVVPPGDGPFAGVLFYHWYDPSAPTNNRT